MMSSRWELHGEWGDGERLSENGKVGAAFVAHLPTSVTQILPACDLLVAGQCRRAVRRLAGALWPASRGLFAGGRAC